MKNILKTYENPRNISNHRGWEHHVQKSHECIRFWSIMSQNDMQSYAFGTQGPKNMIWTTQCLILLWFYIVLYDFVWFLLFFLKVLKNIFGIFWLFFYNIWYFWPLHIKVRNKNINSINEKIWKPLFRLQTPLLIFHVLTYLTHFVVIRTYVTQFYMNPDSLKDAGFGC